MSVKKIYMIGICGIAMGGLAAMLKDSGSTVAGSDENIYPPMSDILKNNNIVLYNGFSSSNIGDPDLVIIGNSVSRGNVEVEYILNNRIPYMSMAQALYTFFLYKREVISVSGTHGKSTTAAILAHILETAGESPSFLVGGFVRNYNSNYRIGNGNYYVIEGDEYDSAFFEKIPKFIFYRPHHLVLTSLEFDHADIFKDLNEIEIWFKRLVNIVPSNGNIVFSEEYKILDNIVSDSYPKKYSFGAINADFCYSFKGYDGDFAELDIVSKNVDFGLRTRLFGEFNYSNIIAAVSMAIVLGIKGGDIQRGIESFEGVKRRQELIYQKRNILIYEDFAHHPTAVKSILQALREKYPDALLWALFEPRSATSRRNTFQDELPGSFLYADKIIISAPYNGSFLSKDERLDINRLRDDIKAKNGNVHILQNVDDILSFIANNIDFSDKNVIVIMSNGGFGGIYERVKIMMDEIIV